ncbi:MAG: response regulator [Candidatus Aminicenantes bacterium]|nr:MAG: response regulator [Candidatus Aminicenantes bacterium]
MSRKILVIDDSPTLRKLLRFYLEKKGYNVHEAHNGRKGLECIAEETFDLIILDMAMPVMNGAEVLEKLKELRDFKIPILILSADKEEESKAIGISLGASYYMTKPFKPPEMVDRIEEIFKERAKQGG